MKKYTAIWQQPTPKEKHWIEEVFGPYIGEHVADGRHEIVLDDAIVFDAFVYCYDPGYFARFRGKNAFLVHFLDENYEGSYHLYENFRGVFRSFWSNVFDQRFVHKIPLGYTKSLTMPLPPLKRATERQFVWFFAGQADKSSRPDMARALLSIEPHLLFSGARIPGISMFNRTPQGTRHYSPPEYTNLLMDSIFSPCPMGNVNIECDRVYEALECGSIPIVEKRWTLDYYRNLLGNHPLPTVRSWDEAAILLRRMIENPVELDRLQERCIAWWKIYKGEYSRQVGSFLSQRSAPDAPPMVLPVSPIQRLPGWKEMELLRHHDARALSRRIGRQAKRFFVNRKWRVAHRPGIRVD